MKYIPSYNIISSGRDDVVKQELKEKMSSIVEDLYNLPRNPISDTTSFIVKSTTIDTSKISDNRFRERNELLILVADMFPALSNLKPEDQALLQTMRNTLKCALRRGYYTLAEQKALDIITFYNESRGRDMRFSQQLITTREELIAKHKTEESQTKKKGFLGFMRPKEEQQTDNLGVDEEFKR